MPPLYLILGNYVLKRSKIPLYNLRIWWMQLSTRLVLSFLIWLDTICLLYFLKWFGTSNKAFDWQIRHFVNSTDNWLFVIFKKYFWAFDPEKEYILQEKSQRKWKFFWNFPKYATPSGIITNACTVSNPGILEYKPPYKCFLNFILISFLWHSIISVDSIDGWSRLQRAVVWTSVCLAFAFTLKNEKYFWICFNEFSKNLRSFCLLLKTCFLISKVILWRDKFRGLRRLFASLAK